MTSYSALSRVRSKILRRHPWRLTLKPSDVWNVGGCGNDTTSDSGFRNFTFLITPRMQAAGDPTAKTYWRVSGERGAAKLLGLKPTTLGSRINKLDIVRPRWCGFCSPPAGLMTQRVQRLFFILTCCWDGRQCSSRSYRTASVGGIFGDWQIDFNISS